MAQCKCKSSYFFPHRVDKCALGIGSNKEKSIPPSEPASASTPVENPSVPTPVSAQSQTVFPPTPHQDLPEMIPMEEGKLDGKSGEDDTRDEFPLDDVQCDCTFSRLSSHRKSRCAKIGTKLMYGAAVVGAGAIACAIAFAAQDQLSNFIEQEISRRNNEFALNKEAELAAYKEAQEAEFSVKLKSEIAQREAELNHHKEIREREFAAKLEKEMSDKEAAVREAQEAEFSAILIREIAAQEAALQNYKQIQEDNFKMELAKGVAAKEAEIIARVQKETQVRFPDSWGEEYSQLQGGRKAPVLSRLDSSSDEFRRAQKAFLDGSLSAKIASIDRVQNVDLYEGFFHKAELISRHNDGKPNIRVLKHGTRSTDPCAVWNSGRDTSTYGFDFRFTGDNNYYGRGSYFAEKSDYSDCYAHILSRNRLRQMFLAFVITGKVNKKTSTDPTLRTPGPGFNSVQGPITDRHQGIIVYEHDQSYPAYLVTYSVD